MNTVGYRIKKHRMGNMLSRRELAEKVDITPEAVRNYEVNKRLPRMGIAIRLSDVLGVSLDDLFRDGAEDEEK